MLVSGRVIHSRFYPSPATPLPSISPIRMDIAARPPGMNVPWNTWEMLKAKNPSTKKSPNNWTHGWSHIIFSDMKWCAEVKALKSKGVEGSVRDMGWLDDHHMDVSKNSGCSPQIIHLNRVFHYKLSILGVPLFLETPIVKTNFGKIPRDKDT